MCRSKLVSLLGSVVGSKLGDQSMVQSMTIGTLGYARRLPMLSKIANALKDLEPSHKALLSLVVSQMEWKRMNQICTRQVFSDFQTYHMFWCVLFMFLNGLQDSEIEMLGLSDLLRIQHPKKNTSFAMEDIRFCEYTDFCPHSQLHVSCHIYIYYHYLKNILYMISCLNLGVCLQNEDKWSLRCFSLGQTWGSDKSQTSTNFSEAAFDGRALLLGSQPDGRGDGLTVIHSWSCWTFGLCRIFKHFHFVRLMNLTIHWCTGFRICHFSSIYLVVVQPSLTALAVQICQLSMATSPWIGYNGCGNMWQLCPVNSPPPPCSWCSGAAADGNVELPAGNGGCQDRGQRGGRICYLDDSRKSLVGGVVHISEFPNIYNMLKYGY